MKKYEQKQIDPNLNTSYKFSIKTGSGQYAGNNSEVSTILNTNKFESTDFT